MHAEAGLDAATLYGFLLALARVSGILVFVPLPGLRSGPDTAKLVFSLALTWCLRPAWPTPATTAPGLLTLLGWLLTEALLGVTVGLLIGLLLEAFQVGAQILSLQAGYSYASTIDPNTQADSGVIALVIQLMSGLCFFAAGLDRDLIAAIARSFERLPPGTWSIAPPTADAVIRAGGVMLATGLRIALPVIAFLLMVDLALALLGRIQMQLQLLTLAFPAKMLASLALLASLAALFPTVFEATARRTLAVVAAVLGG